MIKFKSTADELQYKILNLNEVEVRKRLRILKKSLDRKKSRDMKNRWRRDKNSISKGIKKWHKSTKGKRFHRALGRFNALREQKIDEAASYIYYNWYKNDYEDANNESIRPISIEQINDALLGLSSIETHLYLELQYYEPDHEALSQFLFIIDEFIEDSSLLKIELLKAYESGVIKNEDFDLLNNIFKFFLDSKVYLNVKRESLGLRNDIETLEFAEQAKIVENSETNDKIFETIDNMLSK